MLTISPKLLEQLQSTEAEFPRKLAPESAAKVDIIKIAMDKATFEQMHSEDRMASEKLAEGIQGFTKALIALEKLLTERLARLEGEATVSRAAQEVFRVYDLDGDGFITREEWAGTDAVFDALDMNGDGQISPEEIAAGLGAAFRLAEVS